MATSGREPVGHAAATPRSVMKTLASSLTYPPRWPGHSTSSGTHAEMRRLLRRGARVLTRTGMGQSRRSRGSPVTSGVPQ
jgi:hypothetical protein